MNKTLFIGTIAMLLTSICFATIRRVGFKGAAIAGTDYTSLQLANDAAASGDTIHLYTTVATSASITKKLIIIGFGYNFDANANIQAVGTDAPSLIAIIYFEVGSENSILEGCSFTINGVLEIRTSNITIRRCFSSGHRYEAGSGSVSYPFKLRNDVRPINNTVFESCCIDALIMQSSSGFACVGTQIINCFVNGGVAFYLPETSGLILNCVIATSLNLTNSNFLVKNCIVKSYTSINSNTTYENNFIITAQNSNVIAGTNNRWGQVWANIFDMLGGAIDNPGDMMDASFNENFYKLKLGSPAINGGFDSNNNPTDCGIFGGDAATRYKVGGVPKIPSVYFFSAPTGSAATTNPYNVKVSVRSNN